MAQLGIRHIAAYSPEARGRSERAFRTLQDRLPKELALPGIVTIEAANRWQKRFRRASCASRKSAGSATTTPSNGVGCRCKSRRAHCEPISCARWRACTGIPTGSWRSSMVHTAWPNTDPMDHRVMMPNWPRDPLRRPPGQPPQKRSIDALRKAVKLTRQQHSRPRGIPAMRERNTVLSISRCGLRRCGVLNFAAGKLSRDLNNERGSDGV